MNTKDHDWQRFVDGRSLEGAVSRLIVDSWTRSREAGVDPAADPPRLHRVDDADLRRRLAANEAVLAVARPHLEWATAALVAVRHVVYLVDADGVVLHSTGNAPDLLEACGLLPGYDWSERTMGTNGAGTALATGSAVAVVGCEHFARAWHGATCVAAPVRSPDGVVLGAIDITTSVHDGSPDRLVLAAQIAYAIERELTLRRAQHDLGRLRRLAQASLAVNSTLSIEVLLAVLAEQARDLIGAHAAVARYTGGAAPDEPIEAASVSEGYGAWRCWPDGPDGAALSGEVCRRNRPMRLARGRLEPGAAPPAHHAPGGEGRATRGWLAVPLVGRDGRNRGLIELSDRCEGDFTEEDEMVMVQFAHVASVAIENARLYGEAQAAVRARDAFLARASHELRTPLTAALGMTRFLPRALRRESSETPERLVEVIDRNLAAMRALVDDLLDASRLAAEEAAPAVERVPVAACVAQAVGIVGPHARDRSIAMRIRVPEDLEVRATPLKLEQVLVNLLANAVKFTSPGGRVSVEGAREPEAVVLRVRDTGEGIRPEHLEAVFEPFVQVGRGPGRRPRGTGLGLAICRQIVRLYGGTIRAESDGPGMGSTFVLTLPAWRDAAAA